MPMSFKKPSLPKLGTTNSTLATTQVPVPGQQSVNTRPRMNLTQAPKKPTKELGSGAAGGAGQAGQYTPPVPPEKPFGTGGTDQMFQDLLAQHEGNWADKERIAQNQGAHAQRVAAENAANLGAAWGGGTMAAGVGQAGLKGQEYMLEAKSKHDLQREELQMTYLQQRLREAEASNDHARARELQDLIGQQNILISRIENQ